MRPSTGQTKWVSEIRVARAVAVILVLAVVSVIGSTSLGRENSLEESVLNNPTKDGLLILFDNIIGLDGQSFHKPQIDGILKMKFGDPKSAFDRHSNEIWKIYYFNNGVVKITLYEPDSQWTGLSNEWFIFAWPEQGKPGDSGYLSYPLAPKGACIDSNFLDALFAKYGWLEIPGGSQMPIPPFTDYKKGATAYARVWMDGNYACLGQLEITHGPRAAASYGH